MRGSIERLVIAGYTGRDPDRVQAHIDELARHGIAPPPEVPMFYDVPADRLVTVDSIRVEGSDTSGEVEPVLISLDGRRFIGVGSDHTDRSLEKVDIPAAKNACDKVVAPTVFDYEFAAARWEDLALLSWVGVDREPYQVGSAGELRPPRELSALAPALGDGSVMFMGTVPLLNVGFVASDRFEIQMTTGGHSIGWAYHVERRGR